MFCSNCGSEIAEGAKFCSTCGARVEAVSEQRSVQNNTRPTAEPTHLGWVEEEAPKKKTSGVSFDWSSVIDDRRRKPVRNDIRSPWDSDGLDDEVDVTTSIFKAPESTLEEELFGNETPSNDRGRTMNFIDVLKQERDEKERAAYEAARQREDGIDPSEIPAPINASADEILPKEEREYTKGYTDLKSDIIAEMERRQDDVPAFEDQLANIRAEREARQEATVIEEPKSFVEDSESEFEKILAGIKNRQEAPTEEPLFDEAPKFDDEPEEVDAPEVEEPTIDVPEEDLSLDTSFDYDSLSDDDFSNVTLDNVADEEVAAEEMATIDESDAVAEDEFISEFENVELNTAEDDVLDEEIDLFAEADDEPLEIASEEVAEEVSDATEDYSEYDEYMEYVPRRRSSRVQEYDDDELDIDDDEDFDDDIDDEEVVAVEEPEVVSEEETPVSIEEEKSEYDDEIERLQAQLAALMAAKSGATAPVVEAEAPEALPEEEIPSYEDLEETVPTVEEPEVAPADDFVSLYSDDSDEVADLDAALQELMGNTPDSESISLDYEELKEEPVEVELTEDIPEVVPAAEEIVLEPEAPAAEEIVAEPEVEAPEVIDFTEVEAPVEEIAPTAQKEAELETVVPVYESKDLDLDAELASLGFDVEETPAEPKDEEILFNPDTIDAIDSQDDTVVLSSDQIQSGITAETGSIEDLERDLFGTTVEDDVNAEATRKIDKFYTLYRKNEEFQKLLDEEYNKLNGEYDADLEETVNSLTQESTPDAILGRNTMPIDAESIKAHLDAELPEVEKVSAEEKAAIASEVKTASAAISEAKPDKKAEKAAQKAEKKAAKAAAKAAKDEESDGKAGSVLTVIAIVVAVLLVVLLAIIVILNFFSESALAQTLNNLIGNYTNFIAMLDGGETWL